MALSDFFQNKVNQVKAEVTVKLKKAIITKLAPIGACVFLIAGLFVVIAGAADSDSGGASTGSSGGMGMYSVPGQIVGSTIQEKVWYGLRGLGLGEYATAAAMGNIHYESTTFDPTKIEGNNPANEAKGGIGICQWTNNVVDGRKTDEGRCTDLKAYAAKKGKTWKDEDIQVEFLLAELSGGDTSKGIDPAMQACSTYAGPTYYSKDWVEAEDKTGAVDQVYMKELVAIFCFTFEIPNAEAGIGSLDQRTTYAVQYYNQFKGTELPVMVNGDLYNSDGTVNESKVQELEYSLESSHNLVASGAGFKNMYNTNNANNLTLKRKVTGTFHGYNASLSSESTARGNNGLLVYQCTWWANGRASEYLSQYGTKYKSYPINRGNGGDYYNYNKTNGWFKYGSNPKPNSLFSYNPMDNEWGHIVYVEAVDYINKYIYVSESGGGTHWDGICKYSFSYCEQQIAKNPNKYGFIYLDEPN